MSTATAAMPEISMAVEEFVASEGASEFLIQVLEMTRQVFPNAPLSVLLDIDPEIPADRHARIEVDVSRSHSVASLLRLNELWTRGLLRVCPPTHASVFRLGIS
jgi:hypothetical protein